MKSETHGDVRGAGEMVPVVKSTDYSCSGPECNSQRPRDSSQVSAASIASISDPLFWPPRGPGMQVVLRQTCRQSIHTH